MNAHTGTHACRQSDFYKLGSYEAGMHLIYPFRSHILFMNSKYEELRLHTHLKGLAIAPCKLPCAVFIDRTIAHYNNFFNDL